MNSAKKRPRAPRRKQAYPPFQLGLLGGAVERRYRHLRPELARTKWGEVEPSDLAPELLEAARTYWMAACVNEYRSAGAMADTCAALVAAQVPIDLTAVASRFVLEELSHAELAAQVVVALGGASPVAFDPAPFYPPPAGPVSPLMRAAYYVMRGFCTGESYALPVVQAATRLKMPPLIARVLSRIAKDEAAHASFGWVFFDWAGDRFDRAERAELRRLAAEGVREIETITAGCRDEDEPTLGWLPQKTLASVLARATEEDVSAPLRARGLL
jgi:hypothetical protein